MKIRAKADFYGSIKMDKDETRGIENDPVISDLLKMGLIEILDEQEGGESDESERNGRRLSCELSETG